MHGSNNRWRFPEDVERIRDSIVVMGIVYTLVSNPYPGKGLRRDSRLIVTPASVVASLIYPHILIYTSTNHTFLLCHMSWFFSLFGCRSWWHK